MKNNQNFFPIGATYAPLPKATEVDISEWDADIANMKKLGLNTFRLFLCWDRVEQPDGTLDFSRIDYAFELARNYHMRVIGNVGGTFTNLQAIYPPRRLVYDSHCTLLKPEPDSSGELRFNRFKLCYDDPVYQREAKKFIQTAISRYRNNPELIAWSGWNEPRLAECYCKHTIALYREYLKEKYSDLNTLAKAWSSEFPVFFRTWDDVFPQPKADFENGGYLPFLDWRDFLEKNRRDKFHLVKDWIREIDPVTPVISHLCGPYDSDIFGKEDILGTSIYTIHAQGKRNDYSPYEFAMRQNLPVMAEGRRTDRRDPYGFWVVETEAGPVSWVHNLVPRSYSPRKMNARDMLFVSYGARAILRWLYRSRVSDAQAGEFNLVGWDGHITDRASEFGKLASFLNRNADLFQTHVPDLSGVYILENRDNNSLGVCEGYEGRYCGSSEYLYEALLHCGVMPELCNTRQIHEGILDRAKLLFVPFHPHLDPETAEILRKFVENGGTLIVESPFALKNRKGIHYEVTPGGMTDLFGACVYDLLKLEENACAGIPAYDFHAKIEVLDGTVEGRFANGDPAIVSHCTGKGRTVLYGTVFGSRYQLEKPLRADDPQGTKVISWEEGEPFRAELRKRLAEAGVPVQWSLADGGWKKWIRVVPRLLPDGRRLLFVLNMDDQPHAFRVAGTGMKTVLGSSDEVCRIEDGELILEMKEWGWSVFLG